jgi:nitrite reductase/ring-hydroxylating ferredoxin subunit
LDDLWESEIMQSRVTCSWICSTKGVMPTDELRATREREGSFIFPRCPESWFHLGLLRSLKKRPTGLKLPDSGSFVGYITDSGRPVVLNGRCCHVGSDLAEGSVAGENIACPLHGWEFEPNGACVRIPTGDTIPPWAKQCSYPVKELAGHIFFYNRPKASFELPFFEGVDRSELVPANPFDLLVDSPWYIASSNGFDLQHFRCSHDRRLIGQPVVSCPARNARRIVAHFEVAGRSWRDTLTRAFSGPRVTMDVTDWRGNYILVQARFRRTTSYGLMTSRPLENDRTLARVIVFVRRSGLRIFDRLNAAVRRDFIRAFLQSDVERTAGLDYRRKRFVESDRTLREYLDWLENIHTKGDNETQVVAGVDFDRANGAVCANK